MNPKRPSGMQVKKATGASEPPKQPSLFDRLLGNPATRHDREDAINRLLVRAITVFVVLVIVLVGVVVAVDQFVVPNQAVATVNGENITVREFRDEFRFEQARINQQASSYYQQMAQFGQQFGVTDAQGLEQFMQQFDAGGYQQFQAWQSELGNPDLLGQRVVDELVDNKLVEQKARELNISVDEAQIQTSVDKFFGFDPTQVALIGAEPTATTEPTITPTPFVSPTPTPLPSETPLPTATATQDAEATQEATAEVTAEATEFPTVAPSPTLQGSEVQATYEANVREYRNGMSSTASIGPNVLDAYFRRQALEDAIADTLLSEGNKTLYVNARHILVEGEEQAQEIVDALKAGASFADLAAANSSDGSAQNGGELGWSPVANYVEGFDDAVTNLPIGEISDPVKSEFGYHIIQVRAREEREAKDADLDQVKARLFAKWVAKLRAENEANIQINTSTWLASVPQS
jgi:hypothetical protein